jgi:hypothetical protein
MGRVLTAQIRLEAREYKLLFDPQRFKEAYGLPVVHAFWERSLKAINAEHLGHRHAGEPRFKGAFGCPVERTIRFFDIMLERAYNGAAFASGSGIDGRFTFIEWYLQKDRKAAGCPNHPDLTRATYSSKRPVRSRSRSYRLVSGNGGNQDSRRTIQLS